MDTLCLHVKEFEYYYGRLDGTAHYAASPPEFSRIVSQYDRVISTRLHGAIGALSLGIPAVVVTDGDFRIETASRMFGMTLPIAKTIKEGLTTRTVEPKIIEAAKRILWDKYVEALK
jgi:polysaccharide pyruvyl transferase WcaK-like protein